MDYLHKLGVQLSECAVSADLRLVDVVQALVELLRRGINNRSCLHDVATNDETLVNNMRISFHLLIEYA